MLNSFLLASISVYFQVLFSETWDCGRQIIRNRGGHRVGRAVGGNIARAGSWPWQVLLKHSSGESCGGAIISKWIVVTAAHCFLPRFGDWMNRTEWTVHVGKWRRYITDPHEKIYSVDAINIAPNYTRSFGFDFAHINVWKRTSLFVTPMIVFDNYTQPVCLPEFNVSLAPGTMCYVTGWGRRRNSVTWSGVPSSVHATHLMQAYVPIANWSMCEHFYPPEQWYSKPENEWLTISGYLLCAGYPDRVLPAACYGDSGGPLVCERYDRWYLAGILQGGIDCHNIGLDRYANVSRYVWYYYNGSLI